MGTYRTRRRPTGSDVALWAVGPVGGGLLLGLLVVIVLAAASVAS